MIFDYITLIQSFALLGKNLQKEKNRE